jgi:hypothetical protein
MFGGGGMFGGGEMFGSGGSGIFTPLSTIFQLYRGGQF